jgi:hypothetical protein
MNYARLQITKILILYVSLLSCLPTSSLSNPNILIPLSKVVHKTLIVSQLVNKSLVFNGTHKSSCILQALHSAHLSGNTVCHNTGSRFTRTQRPYILNKVVTSHRLYICFEMFCLPAPCYFSVGRATLHSISSLRQGIWTTAVRRVYVLQGFRQQPFDAVL